MIKLKAAWTAIFIICLAITVNAQQAANDSLKTSSREGSNRNLLMNAASASQPRQISLGLPISGNAYIYEDGLPVSYYNYQLYPYKSWHSGVSHESTATMSPQDMVLKYGIISYSVDSKSKLAGDKFEAPVVPQVTITVDGQPLVIPQNPVFFTNLNGNAECNRYQVYGKLDKNSTLKATANDPAVKFEISSVVEGRATIKATYNGKTKIYLIN